MRFITRFIAVAIAAGFGASAMAQEGNTRAQLRAETAAAVKAGAIPYGEVTRDTSRFVPGKSLAESRAEAAAAVASNQIAYGEVTRFADVQYGPARSRIEVRAETIEAMRLDLVPHGEIPMRTATAAELESIRLAGVRASRVAGAVAAK